MAYENWVSQGPFIRAKRAPIETVLTLVLNFIWKTFFKIIALHLEHKV
jgi:hypothetical protein